MSLFKNIKEYIKTAFKTFDMDRLYVTSADLLLLPIEKHKTGVAFQEESGYVIFLPKEQLDNIKPVSVLKDRQGIVWDIEVTNKKVIAINRIDDKLESLAEIQSLIKDDILEIKDNR